jgi:nitrile hydratase subunit beta
MNSIHDLGGMEGFGPIRREADEPVFHADWERRMFALSGAAAYAVGFGDDHLRREIERVPALDYLESSYYELWYRAIASLLEERGLLEPGAPRGLAPAVAASDVERVWGGGFSTRMPAARVAPGFAIGDPVRARNVHPHGHTRLPRYARGKRGLVQADHGVFSFADSMARDAGPEPQHVYTVMFEARELWGADAPAKDKLYLDLWEAYLEPAGAAAGR